MECFKDNNRVDLKKSRKMNENARLLLTLGVDTAENEPSKAWPACLLSTVRLDIHRENLCFPVQHG